MFTPNRYPFNRTPTSIPAAPPIIWHVKKCILKNLPDLTFGGLLVLSVKKDCWGLLMTRAEGRPRTTRFRSCDVHPPRACVLTCGWEPAISVNAIHIPTLLKACYSTIGWNSNPCTTRALNDLFLLSWSQVQCVAIGPYHQLFFREA